MFAVAPQGFVGRVVDHLLHDVQGIFGSGVHPRTLLDGFETLQHPD
jgi:hypothetical protein